MVNRPYALLDARPLPCRSLVWLLLDGEYVEVTDIIGTATLEASATDVTTLTLRIPKAASGRPADYSEPS